MHRVPVCAFLASAHIDSSGLPSSLPTSSLEVRETGQSGFSVPLKRQFPTDSTTCIVGVLNADPGPSLSPEDGVRVRVYRCRVSP